MSAKRIALLVQWFTLVAVPSLAHVGGNSFPVYYLDPVVLDLLDLHDGSVADWEALVGEPSLTTADFGPLNVLDGASMGAPDLTARVWLGWSAETQRVYVAIERRDDVYINTYEGGDITGIWRYDGVEFMIDGDHTGGLYNGFSSDEYTSEEIELLRDAQAQQYVAIPESPDGRSLGYMGAGQGWVTLPPWSDAGGGAVAGNPTVSVTEFFVTPWDELNWQGPDLSRRTVLRFGTQIGFQVSLPDFDTDPGQYHGFHTLAGQPNTWRLAENFVDGLLLGPTSPVFPNLVAGGSTSPEATYSQVGFGDSVDGSGGELTLEVRFRDRDGQAQPDQAIEWSMSNPGPATVHIWSQNSHTVMGPSGGVTFMDTTDGAGISRLVLDAEGDPETGPTSVTVTASTTALDTAGVGVDLSVTFTASWHPPDPPPVTTVLQPDGGEALQVGTAVTIQWVLTSAATVDLDYSIDDGSSWRPIVAGTADDGEYTWLVPGLTSDQVRVRVTDSATGAADVSDAAFRIVPAAPEALGILEIPELTDAMVRWLDLADGSVADWQDLLGDPVATCADFVYWPTIGDGAPYDTADLACRVWLGWHRSDSRLYVALERVDDAYVNDLAGGDFGDAWRYDGMEIFVDGDHSGGEYAGFGQCSTCTPGEIDRNTLRTAQHYLVVPEAPGGPLIGPVGASGWLQGGHYIGAGGGVGATSPTVSVMEAYVTPFDDFLRDDEAASVPSRFGPDRIIGLELAIPDFDSAPGAYHSYATLGGQPAVWRYAQRFVDARLVGPPPATPSVIAVTSSLPEESEHLGFGYVTGATDGIDRNLGERERPPLPPTGVFDVRFVVGGTQGSLVDLRDPGSSLPSWEIRLQPGRGGYPITLSWDPARLPPGAWTLSDTGGGGLVNVSMNEADSLQVTDAQITSLLISPGCSYDLPPGWSMISLCGEPVGGDAALATHFPEALSLFAFEGGYQSASELSLGEGYWINMPAAARYHLVATPAARVTLDLPAGWSMVGGPAGSVDVAAVQAGNPEVASVFGIDGHYFLASTMESGIGYWVHMDSAGQVTLAPSAGRPAPPAVASFGGVRLWARSGPYRQEIHLGVRPEEVIELPPAPPSDVLDLRVITQSGAGVWHVARSTAPTSVPVRVQGESVRLGWQVPRGLGSEWELTLPGRTVALTGRDEVDLGRLSTPVELMLKQVRRLPAISRLEGNYPNPFNPTTSIRYQLPHRERVSLRIYDATGRLVRELVAAQRAAGHHQVEWDGRDASGRVVSSGVYLCELRAGADHAVRKMMLMR